MVKALPRDAIVGRRSDADVQFDPDRDLEVSTRHALILYENGRWYVRDLGSRNGTWVNGERVRQTELRNGDRLMFGWQGPEAEFHVTDELPAASEVAATRGSARESAAASTGTHAVRVQNIKLRRAVTLLSITVLVLSATMVVLSRRANSLREQERAALLARIDTLLAAGETAVQALAGQREELAAALRASQEDVRRVRDQIARAPSRSDTASDEGLRRQLQTAMAALERQQLAASLDFARIERESRRAVAVIWVENAAGTIMTGTAFAIRPDATLATSRHLVRDDQGRPARRLAIQFADSDQVWPARVLSVSATADLAVVKVDNIVGTVPTVRGLNARADTLLAGLPVALIGFPLGGETWPQDARTGRVARPLGSVGVITAASTEAIEIQGYGAAGASGSPVFDANGEVIAVLMGGRRTGGAPILSAVSATRLSALLEQGR
jgi:S1-C subfamily serine protease